MTVIDSRSFARVVVIAPRTRVDLALPVDVPLVDLLPLLLDLVGERSEDGGGRHGGWKLARVGAEELPSDRTLRSLDILDGTALHLTPREAAAAPPIYDDVVDAIASVVRDRMSDRPTNPAAGAAAAAAALAVGAATVLYYGHTAAGGYLALTGALLALVLGVAVARGPGERVIATAVAAGGIPYAFIIGLNIVPGTNAGRSGVLLGCSIALVYSVIALAAIGTGTVVFVAAILMMAFGAGTAGVCTAFNVIPLRAVAGACAVGIAAISVLPWFVVRLARLPLPFIPTSAADLRNREDVDIDEVTDRARIADEYLNGSYIGCAAVVAFSSAIVALHATLLSIALAVACVLALALRTRSLSGLVPRAAILAIVFGGATLAGLLAVSLHPKEATAGLFAATLGVALIAVLISVAAPRIRFSPSTLRAADFVEAVTLIAILPLAAGVMDLYAVMRHL